MRFYWLALLLTATLVGCGSVGSSGGNDGSSAPSAGQPQNQTGAAALNPSAEAFLNRGGFLGFASLNDRAIGRNRFLVFHSRLDLIPTDTNGQADIYLRDLKTGDTSLVSVASDGTQGNGDSSQASISSDGRFVVFRSAATNLVASDGNSVDDIFLRDLAAGTTTRVSVATGSPGAEANGASRTPAVSDDGTYVVFASTATNLGGTDSNGVQDIFLRDTANNTTTLVSDNSANTDSANGASYDPAITPDGDFIAFSTASTDIITGGLNGQRQIVRIDRATPANRVLISQSNSGSQADSPCYEPSMSDSGEVVAFFTLATNLGITPDTNNFFDVYVRNHGTNDTRLESQNQFGGMADNHSGFPSLSSDGSVVAFGSLATNLVNNDTNNVFDVFSRVGGFTTRVSVSTAGAEANIDSDLPAISQDGRYVAFRTAATNLVSLDTVADDDILVRDQSTPTTFWSSVSCVFPTMWPGLAARTDHVVGNNPYSVAIADFNNDTFMDFASADFASSQVTVAFGNASGLFTTAAQYTVSGPYCVAAADLNGDLVPDLAVTSGSLGQLNIFLNNGSGTFGSPSTFTVGSAPYSMAIGRLDADTDLDIVVGNFNDNDVSVLLNNGSGNFGTATDFPARNAYSVVLVDVDANGVLDVATANTFDNTLDILINDGTGSLAAAVTYATGSQPRSVAVGQLDGNTSYDLVTACEGDDTIRVHFNDGSGDFTTNSSLTPPFLNPNSLAVADFNGDTSPDIAAGCGFGPGVVVYANNGSGAFTQASVSVSVFGTRWVAFGDLDGDTDLDLAVAGNLSHEISLLFNQGNATFLTAPTHAVGDEPHDVALGDMDGDGDPDVVNTNYQGNTVTVSLNDGTGSLAAATSLGTVSNGPSPIALDDLDGDGDLDVVVGRYLTTQVQVLLNDGSGGVASSIGYTSGNNPRGVALGDLDKDGDVDIAVAAVGSGGATILLNNGTGAFAAPVAYVAGTTPWNVALGDLDGDGDLDLVTANRNSSNVSVLLNNGSASFGSATNTLAASTPVDVELGDLDGDGDLDVVVVCSTQVVILTNNGSGTLASSSTHAMSAPQAVHIADLDGDADLDLAVTAGTANLVILHNDGSAGFTEMTNFGQEFSTAAGGIDAGDLDLDGDLDFVFTNPDGDQITVMLNRACP